MSNVFTSGMEIHERRLTTQVLLLCIYTTNTTPTHCWVLQHTAILLLLLPVTTAKAPALKKERSHGSGLRACQHHHHHQQHPPSLQDHTAPHINPLSSSSRAQKDVGRPWQVSQKQSGHTCTTKYFLLIQTQSGTEQNRTEEDVGAKLQHRNPMRAHKKIPKKESTQYFLQILYFYQVGKASETQVGHLWTRYRLTLRLR